MRVHRLGTLILLLFTVAALGGEPAGPRTSIGGRTKDEVAKKIHEFSQLPAEAAKDPLERERLQALRRLMAYRYLVGVSYENVAADEEYTKLAEAAAKLCAKLGKLDHDPKKNPGLSEEEFKLGVKGTNSCNLGFGHSNLAQTIDAYIEDADETNIADLGHRRWCLNPRLQKTGMGRAGKFTAMYCFDQSQKNVPAFDMIAFPPPGPMPLGYMKAHWPWNVSLNLEKYKAPVEKDVKVRVSELLEGNEKKACTLNFFRVSMEPYGVPACVIFRPELKELRDGQRFLVEVDGLEAAKGKAAVEPLRYVVEFFKL